MELSRKSCRLCLSETEFNVSLFGNYSRKSNIINKIAVCLKLVIDETDFLNTICYKCADNIERYYDYLTFIRKCQSQLGNEKFEARSRKAENLSPNPMNRRHITSYVREQIYDADYTFSFLEMPNNEEKKECKNSSPFFSYFSPPNCLVKQSGGVSAWKTPQTALNDVKPDRNDSKFKRHKERGRHHSRDLFDSQSQDVEDAEARSLDWRLTPDDNLMKRVREKCFGRSDF